MLKPMEIPSEIKSKKLIMTSEFFVDEATVIIRAVFEMVKESPEVLNLTEEDQTLIAKNFAIGYLSHVYENNAHDNTYNGHGRH